VDYVLGNDLRQIIKGIFHDEKSLGRTVEFGCGTGYFTPLLAQLSEGVVATDIAEPMLERTRERVRDLSSVTVQWQDCEQTTFPAASFDTAILGLTFQLVDGQKTSQRCTGSSVPAEP
jgi:ubiquinone/menaquinone biosynthesis C-methylase UbiE